MTRALVIGFALLLALAGVTALAPAQESPLSGADATALLVRVTDERVLSHTRDECHAVRYGPRAGRARLEGPGVMSSLENRAPFHAERLPAGAYRLVIAGRDVTTYALGAGEVKEPEIAPGTT